MASWSRRRRSAYIGILAILIIAVIGIPAFFFLYHAPTCSDGRQDGNEQGVDCGGSCQRLCPSSFLSPDVLWTSFEEITPGQYNIGAYIINPNPDAGAVDVPYDASVYDGKGMLITDYTGMVTLPPHRNTLAFAPAISVGQRIPAQVVFQFTATPDWQSESDPLAALTVDGQSYSETASGSSFTADLYNTGALPMGELAVYVVLYDKDKNAVGFSKTLIDGITAGGSAIAPFTWPIDRNGAVVSEEVLPVAQ